jgi:hypothetical protein
MDVRTVNAKSVQLPLELRELVVKALGTDYAAAHKLSLANRAWSAPARAYALKHKFHRLRPRSVEDCAQLLALMDANPDMAGYVRHLTLGGQVGGLIAPAPADTPAFGDLCMRLSALEVIEFRIFLPLPAAASLACALASAGVRPTTIQIHHSNCALALVANLGQLAPLLSTVVHIELSDVEFLDTGSPKMPHIWRPAAAGHLNLTNPSSRRMLQSSRSKTSGSTTSRGCRSSRKSLCKRFRACASCSFRSPLITTFGSAGGFCNGTARN